MRKRTRAAPAAGLAGSLLKEVLAEPGRLPESLASFALRHLGPGAGPTVARLREAHPEADAAALRALVVTRGRRSVTAEGAFVGGPFLLLIPVAFCGALLTQVRTVLEIAVVEGWDSTDPQRAAELLVLQGVYGDTETARAALDPAGTRPGTGGGRGRVAALQDLITRMARLLGLVTPDDGAGRWVRIGRWALLGAVFLVGLVAPLVWLPYMATGYYRATTRLTDRATVYYVGSPDPRSPRGVRLDPVMARAGLRAVGSVLLPTVAIFLVVVTDIHIAGGRWPVLGIVLTTSCLVSGGWWLWRHHKRRS
ncbi:hypothetical protein OG259_01680 [Streptomyces sp. NBC_00250]|uniref:hypothetical protein n=1 Tax=Streptomyces sp. NBC_00250 TaxID=2903641 RepID=UPI002E2D211C|nr:hypothetical protein [Streptomyces sp. NBC_00250]